MRMRAKTASSSGSEYKIVKSKLSHRATYRRSRAIEKFIIFFQLFSFITAERRESNATARARARAQQEKKEIQNVQKQIKKEKKREREREREQHKTHSKLPISDRFPSLHVLFQTCRAHDGCYYYCVCVLADERLASLSIYMIINGGVFYEKKTKRYKISTHKKK